MKLSSENNLCKMTSHFELMTQSSKIRNLTSNYYSKLKNKKFSVRVTNSKIKLLFFHFWVTNSKLKIKSYTLSY